MELVSLFKPRKYVNKFEDISRKLSYSIGREVLIPVEVEGHSIIFSTRNQIEYQMRSQLSYVAEQTTMRWIRDIVGVDDIVYDVGANVGAYSLLIGKRIKSAGGNGQVFAIEPESLNFASLNRNIYLNNLQDTVMPICMAMGPKVAVDRFLIRKFEAGAATHSLEHSEKSAIDFKPAHIQGSVVMSLDDFSSLDGAKFPNHIKIDVDGLEYDIIKNMPKVLRDQRLKSLIIEIDERLAGQQITSMICGANFSVFAEEKIDQNIKNIIFKNKA